MTDLTLLSTRNQQDMAIRRFNSARLPKETKDLANARLLIVSPGCLVTTKRTECI